MRSSSVVSLSQNTGNTGNAFTKIKNFAESKKMSIVSIAEKVDRLQKDKENVPAYSFNAEEYYHQDAPASPLSKQLQLRGYVGFDRICTQYVNKIVKEGFAFNIMCIGETGIGKSTLMNTLFNTDFDLPISNHHVDEVRLNSKTFDLCENDVSLKLTIVKSSGYGDQINKANSHDSIVGYIDSQYEAYVQQELQLKRTFKQINDTRVHVCLYFITPTGHSLKALDIRTMKALDRKCNVVPVIAKADTISKSELIEFKRRIMADLNASNVDVYQFPINDYELDIRNMNASANALYPLAVIGSTDLVKVGNKLTRGRHYEWGTVSVENESHCDFLKLREMLLSTNMLDLIEVTHTRHFQLFRANRLKEMGFSEEECTSLNLNGVSNGSLVGVSIIDVFNAKRAKFEEEMARKEADIKEEFAKKVVERENDIKEAEKRLTDKYNKWKQEQEHSTNRIDSKRKELDDQIEYFNRMRKFTLEKSKLSTLTSSSSNKLFKGKNKH